jgi:hypothetical protein
MTEKLYSAMSEYSKTSLVTSIALTLSLLAVSLIGVLIVLFIVRRTGKGKIVSLSLFSELQRADVQELIMDIASFLKDYREDKLPTSIRKTGISGGYSSSSSQDESRSFRNNRDLIAANKGEEE